MSKTKEETVQQWQESIAESARLAVEALSAITTIDKPVPTTDEASEILGHAILRIRELVRPEPKTVAFLDGEAWHRVKLEAEPAGEYRTPNEAIDFVTANPPLDIPPADEPIQPGAPQMVPGEKPPFTTASLASIPELNIEFHAYHTKDYYKFLCWWHNEHEAAGRVYELTVKPGDAGDFWYANAQAGGKHLFSLGSYSKRLAIECGLVAMRRYLIRGHRAAWRTYSKAAKAAAVPKVPTVPTVPAAPRPAPLTPEEEIADTITREKEVM